MTIHTAALRFLEKATNAERRSVQCHVVPAPHCGVQSALKEARDAIEWLRSEEAQLRSRADVAEESRTATSKVPAFSPACCSGARPAQPRWYPTAAAPSHVTPDAFGADIAHLTCPSPHPLP